MKELIGALAGDRISNSPIAMMHVHAGLAANSKNAANPPSSSVTEPEIQPVWLKQSDLAPHAFRWYWGHSSHAVEAHIKEDCYVEVYMLTAEFCSEIASLAAKVFGLDLAKTHYDGQVEGMPVKEIVPRSPSMYLKAPSWEVAEYMAAMIMERFHLSEGIVNIKKAT